jgi:hypothetical protein
MAFPLSPTNGQTAVLNGITYSYSYATNVWTRVAAAVPNTHKSTSSANSPASPNIGDIWYNTVTDDIYRYTSDGTSSYWLDTTGASTTLTTGAASALVVSQPTYAVSFNGTSQYLTVVSNAAFGYGTGDFTIEFWLYLNTTALQTIVSNLLTVSGLQPYMYYSGTNLVYWTAGVARITGSALSTNVWYHVAVTKASSNTKLFVNGTQSGSTYADSNDYGTSNPVTVGQYWTTYPGTIATANYLNGSISNLRIVKGTALYTANFAVPSTPLTAVTGTSLLTCQNVPVTDASTNAFAVTNAGGASLSIYAAPAVSYASQTLYYRLNTALVGTNSTAVQNVLGVGVTLSGNTVYQFSGEYYLSKTAGTTPCVLSLGFGGNATLNNIWYITHHASLGSTTWNFVDSTASGSAANQAAQSPVTGTSTAQNVVRAIRISGTVSVNAGGTFIPQYSLSAAGGAYTVNIGSYITFTPIGAAGANSSLGTWA